MKRSQPAGWTVLLVGLLLLSGCTNLAALVTTRSQQLLAEGDRLATAGRTNEAILAYRQAADLDGRNAAALRKLGAAYAQQGRRRLGQRYLSRAAALQPSDVALAAEVAALATPTASAVPGRLRLAWQRAVGEDVAAGMAVTAGVVYVTLEGGRVQALAAETGNVIFDQTLPVAITSPPGVGPDLLVVGAQDGSVRGLDLGSGHQRWAYTTRAPVYAAPLVTRDTVYCPGGDGTLYALSAADGRIRWQFPTGGALHASATLAGGVLYFGSTDGRIYAVDAATGAARWPTGILTQNPVESQPAVTGGRLFAGSGDGRLYALALDAGGEYWRYSTPDAIYATPVVISDTIYLASNGHTLTALNTISGEAAWEVDTAGPAAFTPAFDGHVLYVMVTAQPDLYAYDAGIGSLLWQMDTGDWPGAPPVVNNGKLYVLGKDGTLLAYEGFAR